MQMHLPCIFPARLGRPRQSLLMHAYMMEGTMPEHLQFN